MCKAASDNTLPSCVSLGWFCLLPPLPYYRLLSMIPQVLGLLDLIPWIFLYLSPPLYIHRGFKSYLTGLVVFPAFFSLSLNFAMRSCDLSHSQLQVLFLLTVHSFSIFGYNEYNQLDFSIDYLVMSICRAVFCVVGRGCLLWPVCSLGKTQWAFALLHFVLQGQTCLLLQVSPDFLLLYSSPLW